jgi:hypothetical protein
MFIAASYWMDRALEAEGLAAHLQAHKGAVNMNDAQLNDAIASRPHPKVTKEGIEKRITKVDYMVLPNSTVTICNITLENGFSVRGESACVDPRNFDLVIGQSLAHRDAFSKLWQLEGYLLAEKRWMEAK